MINNFYVLYKDTTTINYIHLLLLYSSADYNKDTKLFDTITFNNLQDLTDKLNKHYCGNTLSKATVSRLLNNKDYEEYFLYNAADKKITLKNNFRKKAERFITISQKEKDFLIKENNNFLAKYYFYLVYYCGYSKSKTTDSTGKQILSIIGYSESGKNLQQIAAFNSLLAASGFIKIDKYRDSCGYWRNTYSIL